MFLVVVVLLPTVPSDEGVDVELPLAAVIIHEPRKNYLCKSLLQTFFVFSV